MQYRVEPKATYTLVRLDGVLDRVAASRVHGVLMKCLADRPAAVIVEVARLQTADRSHLLVLLAAARQAARWPVVPFLVCAPGPALAPLLHGPLFRALHVAPTLDAAEATLGTGASPLTIIEEILPVSGAARRAREVVSEACERWELPRLADPACVIATELVANAVRHARTLIELHVLLRPRHLCLAVRDGSSRPPQPGRPHRDGGRGLALVDAFSLAWGHLPTGQGKVVWATLNR